jgi:AcrR family transcriptional regulator
VSTTPVRTRPRDRRQSLEAAAASLFADRGFAGTSVADIAAEVGITPGAIYRHFSGKEELLERIVLGSLARIGEVFDIATADAPADSEARIRALVGALLNVAQDNRAFVGTYLRERHRLTSTARAKRRSAEQRLTRRLGDLVLDARPGVSGLDVAMRLRAMNGTLASVATRRQTVPWPRLHALFLDGITAVLLAPADRPAAPAADPNPKKWSAPRSRREDILAAAVRLFRQQGYHGVGIDEIGVAAGIAGPTVYGNYASKVDILLDAVDRAVATVEVLTDRAFAQAGSAAEAMRLFTLSFAETVMHNVDIIAVAAREVRALPEHDRVRLGRSQTDARHRTGAVLAQVRPELAPSEARAVLAASYALAEEVCQERQAGTPSAESVADLMRRFLLS